MKHWKPSAMAAALVLACGLRASGAEPLEAPGGFPEPLDSERDTAAAPLAPADAAASIEVPPGFRVEVFAAEPDVRNPIAMAWDARGRLWVAENFTYAESPTRTDRRFRDRVLVFGDRGGAALPRRPTVFLDGLEQLTGIETGLGGVWLMCPPRLLFVPDHDGDDVPDGPARVVLDGFDVALTSHHNFANGLRFGPDGWLYGRCGGSCPGAVGPPGSPDHARARLAGGIWRYDPVGGRFEVVCHGTTNPWGHDWNEFGDGFFVNTVNGHLWQIIPGAHFVRRVSFDPNPHVYEMIDTHADHWHFDTGAGWERSRGGAANDHGGGHAHVGAMIYLGDDWPAAYRGRLFTWNMHGLRANQEILERRGSGYVARHGDDVFLVRDPFFRGMDLAYGPDGSVLAIDWSDTGECHDRTGVHRSSGRIYRIVHGRPAAPGIDLAAAATVDLARLATHANEWFPRRARIVLAERAGRGMRPRQPVADLPEAIAVLRRLGASDDPRTACRAVLALHAVGGCDGGFLRSLLAHPDEHLRAWGVRLLGDSWPIDGLLGPTAMEPAEARRVHAEAAAVMPDLKRLAATEPSGLVRLALASTLQRLPVDLRADLATALVVRSEDADDHNLPLLVWYGVEPLVAADPTRGVELALACRWPKTQRLIARRVAGLVDRDPAAVDGLVAGIMTATAVSARAPLVMGISDGLAGRRRAPRPRGWDAVESAHGSGDSPLATRVRDLSALFGDGRAVEEIVRLATDETADDAARVEAIRTLVRHDAPGLREVCLRLLADRRFSVSAAEGLVAVGDPADAPALVAAHQKIHGVDRPRLVALLVTRREYAGPLVAAVAAGRIPKEALTAYDLRQISALGDAALDAALEREYGRIGTAPEEARRRIEEVRGRLGPAELAKADLPHGRVLFEAQCGRCHQLFGSGGVIGPDLTGGNRTNLDHLLENIVAPDAVVSRDFRLSVVTLEDGRVLGGLVTARDDRTLTLVTPTDQVVLPLDEVEEVTVTPRSPMPGGILDLLPPDGVRDLIAYLMQPAQVPLPVAAAAKSAAGP